MKQESQKHSLMLKRIYFKKRSDVSSLLTINTLLLVYEFIALHI